MIPLNANTIMQLNILAQLLAGAQGLANPQRDLPKGLPKGLMGPRPMLAHEPMSVMTAPV